ncbi:MAG TPA: M1 family metallopeptidase [Fimbriimonadaceae bacterium]|nr:M1 family metallopeptidase [Fimbriimonadaceae bacterium]
MRPLFVGLGLGASSALALAQADLRDGYDVDTYRVDLKVDPVSKSIGGTGVTVAKVTAPSLDVFELDLLAGRTVKGIRWVDAKVTPTSSLAGKKLAFDRDGDHIMIHLAKPLKEGSEVRVAVDYEYAPGDRRSGIFFHQTPDGKPWVQTECQGLGAHSWWPCKNDNEHPEDKFAHFFMNATVPNGLTAVSNGNLLSKETKAGWTTFHWRHDYPCENYAIVLDVAPYVEFDDTFSVPGSDKPVHAAYYVLPQDLEKAKLQFADAPRMVQIYSEMFGPWPYTNEKYSLVETDFWGEEHSTAVSYGNTFPKWLKLHNQRDLYAQFNSMFDYILIHECAHEWWGNAVSARDWGHLWIHEGFATYTEAVYAEKMFGREKADEWLAQMKPRISPQFREYRGKNVLPSQAFDNNVYYKGAWILNTLRTYVDNDEQWWKALKEFNLRFRYKVATTEDFQSVLEEVTKQSWQEFFLEWFYNDAIPVVKGTVRLDGQNIVVDVDNPEQHGCNFHLPLDLEWKDGDAPKKTRLRLQPGANHFTIPAGDHPADLKVVNLNRMLGQFDIKVAAANP